MGVPAAALSAELRAAYLDRLGLEAEPPSADALHRIHRRHVERVPYETMWIHSGDVWSTDPVDAAVRIAIHGRGGYCYHLNGALAALLRSLGYDVREHVGGVHGPEGPNADAVGNHLVLTVRGLPSGDNGGGDWYVDTGLGDALHEPLPLVPGAYLQPPFHLTLEDDSAGGGWHLNHDPSGGFTGMTWTTGDARREILDAKHAWLSTSPESGFVRVAMAERRDATGVDVIRGLVLSRIGSDARAEEPVIVRQEWFDLLAERFDLRFDAEPPEMLDHLWEQVLARHRLWEASGMP